jgi:hypothetical protein
MHVLRKKAQNEHTAEKCSLSGISSLRTFSREQAFHSEISRTIGISNKFSVRDEASKIIILKVPAFCPWERNACFSWITILVNIAVNLDVTADRIFLPVLEIKVRLSKTQTAALCNIIGTYTHRHLVEGKWLQSADSIQFSE